MPLFKQLRRVCLFAVKCGENVLYGCRGSYIFEHIHAFDISLIENFLTKIMFFFGKNVFYVLPNEQRKRSCKKYSEPKSDSILCY